MAWQKEEAARQQKEAARLEVERRKCAEAEAARPDKVGWLKTRQVGPDNSLLEADWQEMWFVLKGPMVTWHQSEKHEPAGSTLLTAESVILTARKSLEIVCGQTTLLLLASTEPEMAEWKVAFETAALAFNLVHFDAAKAPKNSLRTQMLKDRWISFSRMPLFGQVKGRQMEGNSRIYRNKEF